MGEVHHRVQRLVCRVVDDGHDTISFDFCLRLIINLCGFLGCLDHYLLLGAGAQLGGKLRSFNSLETLIDGTASRVDRHAHIQVPFARADRLVIVRRVSNVDKIGGITLHFDLLF